MNPLFVLSCTVAAAMAAPSGYETLAVAPVAPVAYAHAPVAYAQVAPAPIAVPAPYTTSAIHGADSISHSQAPAVITKSLSFGSKDFVSGHISAIHKPAIPDFRIQVPTALKQTVRVNAPQVKTVTETHVVNEPVPVIKQVEVPYDVPVYKEQIVEVPQAVHHVKHVPVHVPYPVQGKTIVNTKYTAPVVKHTHSHHVAQPAVHVAQPAVYAAQPQVYANHAGYAYGAQPALGYAAQGYAAQPALQAAYAYAPQPAIAAEY